MNRTEVSPRGDGDGNGGGGGGGEEGKDEARAGVTVSDGLLQLTPTSKNLHW